MDARRLEGKTIAADIQERIAGKVQTFADRGLPKPSMVSIQTSEDPSAAWYIGQQEKLAAKLGIGFRRVPSSEIKDERTLSKDRRVQRGARRARSFRFDAAPEGFDADKVLLAMDPRKDVEGIHPTSLD